MMENSKIEKEELNVWGRYITDYFLEILNGEKSVSETLEDLKSFRNTKYYTGDNPKFKRNENKTNR